MTGEQAERHRAEVAESQTRRGWYWWLVMVVTAVVGPGLAIGVSAANQRRSEQALCEVVVLSDDAYRAHPPATPTGQQIAAAMARLREKYHCP
ncbi:MAG: hypothetical protein QOH97_1300 [Actinoplanes sp.]|nr:hypothetical protein [Actinoplanes sp.]